MGGLLLPGFSDGFVQRVRDAVDIVSLVESYLPLKGAGGRYKALCPFHNEKTPSFTVNPDLQIFKCFGCGAGGDAFGFVMKMDGLTFPEAIRALAERAGLPLEYDEDHDPAAAREVAERKSSLFWVLSKALAYFEECLASHAGKEAQAYLESRGFTAETIRTWRLGWAPERSTGLLAYLSEACGGTDKREACLDFAEEAGLVRTSEERGDRYAFFRGRVMFPILDLQHRPIAFGGRILRDDPEKRVGKYVNSPESPLFNKSRVLFGLDAANREIRRTETAIIVEGYTDVIMCHQYGLRNVVATLGTALTQDHVRLLRRYAKTAIALFDADAAGEKATDASIRIFAAEDMPLRVVRSDQLKDACEYLPTFGVEPFRKQIDEAPEAFAYLMQRAFAAERLRDVNARAQAVSEVMAVVNSSPNPVKRDMLRRQVASLSGVAAEALPRPKTQKGRAPEGRRGLRDDKRPDADLAAAAAAGHPAPQPDAAQARLEKRLLLYLAARQDWCDRACRILPPEEYSAPLLQAAAAELHDAWNDNAEIDAATVLRNIPDAEAGELLAELFFAEGPEQNEAEFRELLCRARLARLQEEVRHLQRDLQTASAEGNQEEAVRLSQRITETRREMEEVKEGELREAIDGSAA